MSNDELLDRMAMRISKENSWNTGGERVIADLLFQILRELRKSKEAKKK